MCTVSMTGDFFGQRWPEKYPWISPPVQSYVSPQPISPPPTKEDFDKLKLEVELLKELLVKSKEYDKKNGEPDCEIDDKMKFLKQVAKSVGIELDEILKKDKL